MRKIPVFGILPVFKKIGNPECIFEICAQSSLSVPSIRAKKILSAFLRNTLKDLYLCQFSEWLENSLKNTGFSVFYRYFERNTTNSDMIFEFYDQNYLIPESFKEIGQFFRFSPKPVRILSMMKRCWTFCSKHSGLQHIFTRNLRSRWFRWLLNWRVTAKWRQSVPYGPFVLFVPYEPCPDSRAWRLSSTPLLEPSRQSEMSCSCA